MSPHARAETHRYASLRQTQTHVHTPAHVHTQSHIHTGTHTGAQAGTTVRTQTPICTDTPGKRETRTCTNRRRHVRKLCQPRFNSVERPDFRKHHGYTALHPSEAFTMHNVQARRHLNSHTHVCTQGHTLADNSTPAFTWMHTDTRTHTSKHTRMHVRAYMRTCEQSGKHEIPAKPSAGAQIHAHAPYIRCV